MLIGELIGTSSQRKQSLFEKFVDPDQSEEKDGSFQEDQEIKMIEATEPESQLNEYPLASTTTEEKTVTETETDNETTLKNEQNTTEDKASPSFEILTSDANTQKKFLENINLDDSNHLSENELKSTVFNALNTIDKLQNELV